MLLFNHTAIYAFCHAFTTSKQELNLEGSLITCMSQGLELYSLLCCSQELTFIWPNWFPARTQALTSSHKPMWEGPTGTDDSMTVIRLPPIFPCKTTRGLEGPCKNMFSVTKTAIWFKSSPWDISLCCSWEHIVMSQPRSWGQIQVLIFSPSTTLNATLTVTTAQYRSPCHHYRFSPNCRMKDWTNFFFFSIKPNPKKTMLSGMIAYIVTKLWVSVKQKNFYTILPITEIYFFIIK